MMHQTILKVPRRLKKPPWRTITFVAGVLGLAGLAYWLWSPGARILDGRHDLRSNGIWVQHGWLGDDGWFERNGRDKSKFRNERAVRELADRLASHGIKCVYPHLCPCSPTGRIAPVDASQAERFLDAFESFRVLPWIGGVRDEHCSLDSATWRASFAASAAELLRSHPRLAGVHINIEPMPSGDPDFLTLLAEVRQALPRGKMLSVAAYPPPTRWHPFPDVHWDQTYYGQVAQHADQMAIMMYDTAIRWARPYQRLMADWTEETLAWVPNCEVLLGVPAYDDADSGYHFKEAEDLRNAVRGIHAGLERFATLPANYRGIAIYSEWEMDAAEWDELKHEFERPSGGPGTRPTRGPG